MNDIKKEFEEKFVVINKKDLGYLNESGKVDLSKVLLAITIARSTDGKKLNKYYVCNQDEPYAQSVIDIIPSAGDWMDQ